MIDLLIAAASDPLGSMLVAVLVFAFGMYPVGLMLGAPCSPCCGCANCEEGTLPETLTLTFNGLPDEVKSSPLVNWTALSCTGSGGAGIATFPGGDLINAGPLVAVEVTKGGQKYALFGREEPAVVLSKAGNNDTKLNFTLTKSLNDCGHPEWSVTSIAVADGGSGYLSGDFVTFEPAPGSTADPVGYGIIKTALETPEITITATPGDGATFEATFEPANSDPDKFQVASVVVKSPGSGYIDGTIATITPSSTTTEESGAVLILRTQRTEPTLSLTTGLFTNASNYDITPELTEVPPQPGAPRHWKISSVTINDGGEGFLEGEQILVAPTGLHTEARQFYGAANVDNQRPDIEVIPLADNGTGGALQASLSQIVRPDGSKAWIISSISITAAGQGYAPGGTVGVVLLKGSELTPLEATLTVDGSGGLNGVQITNSGEFAVVGVLVGVTIFDEGEYFFDTGVAESVEIAWRGVYFNDTGEITSVQILWGGTYYKENPNLPPLVPEVTVLIVDQPPSDGEGGVLIAEVDTDTASATFGQIIGISIANPGDGYLAWIWERQKCCGTHWNGKQVVVKRMAYTLDKCVFQSRPCGLGNTVATVSVTVKRAPAKWEISIAGDTICTHTWTAPDPIINCDSINFTATHADGSTVTVVGEGEFLEFINNKGGSSCFSCCKGGGIMPEEVLATFASGDPFYAQYNGDYVLQFEGVFCPPPGPSQCTAAWSAGFPQDIIEGLVPPELCYIRAELKTCSLVGTTRFFPLVELADEYFSDGVEVRCDDCHRKCLTEVSVGQARFVFAGGGGTFCSPMSHRVGDFLVPGAPNGDARTAYAHCTQLCTATPQCRPAPGGYPVRSYGCYGVNCTNEVMGTVTIQ